MLGCAAWDEAAGACVAWDAVPPLDFEAEEPDSLGEEKAGELELAYAMTVHKSQGSEFPAVVIPMFPGP